MKAYRTGKGKWKIEANNCVINITENLTDRYGRNVTSIAVSPDTGEHKNVLRGYYNTRVVTLKKKRKA